MADDRIYWMDDDDFGDFGDDGGDSDDGGDDGDDQDDDDQDDDDQDEDEEDKTDDDEPTGDAGGGGERDNGDDDGDDNVDDTFASSEDLPEVDDNVFSTVAEKLVIAEEILRGILIVVRSPIARIVFEIAVVGVRKIGGSAEDVVIYFS